MLPLRLPSRRVAALVAALVLGSPSSSSPHGALELHTLPFAAGETIAVRRRAYTEIEFDVESGGYTVPGFQIVSCEELEKEIRVLIEGEGEDGPTVIEVEYASAERELAIGEPDTLEDEDADAQEHPLDGRTFRIEREADGFSVEDEDGDLASDEVAELVLAEETAVGGELLGVLGALARDLCDEPLEQGLGFDIDEEIALALVRDEEGALDSAAMELVYVGSEERDGVECALFTVELTASGVAEGDLELEIELEGELVLILASARTRSLELEGSIDVHGDEDEEYSTALRGAGRLEIELFAAYGDDD